MPEIIIVAPYFPPSSLPPSHRVKLLVRHFHEYGFNPTVVTVDQKFREDIADDWFVSLLGNKYEEIKIKCLHQKFTRKFAVGDLGLRMLPYLFPHLINVCKKKKASFVLYHVPPWYIIAIAPIIRRITGVPYGVDFIDPWVHQLKSKSFKSGVSQWIAKRMEGYAIKNASVIFSVSDGILTDLCNRYPKLKSKQLVSVPYGVEVSEYEKTSPQDTSSLTKKIRYIGAVSDAMIPVVRVILNSFKQISDDSQDESLMKVDFIGTSYAGGNNIKPRLDKLINEMKINKLVTEYPSRVPYKEAIQLTLDADILLLIGDTTRYYAASKLMGLIASQRPFFAVLHYDSFPAKFLRELNYEYIVYYNDNLENGSLSISDEIKNKYRLLLEKLDLYEPISLDSPSFLQYTASGMTKTFVSAIEKSIL